MLRIVFPLLGCLLHMLTVNAQSELFTCGTESPSPVWEHEFQQLISQTPTLGEGGATTYTIPVVFHVIHGGEPVGTFPNILQGQVNAQIIILNQDFNGNAYNASNYPVNAFVNWASDMQIPSSNLDQSGRIKMANLNIQFCLATTDVNGNLMAEPGIDRINYLEEGLPDPTQFATQSTMKTYLDNILKPQSVWDVTRYLNVWITDKSNALTYAGVSSVPPLSGLAGVPNTSTDSTDGIWCYTKAIGSYALFPEGTYASPIVDGRTMTHEIGHYLGLRHIWGDAVCGNDFCNDTPPASGQNTGSPVYPHNTGSCPGPSNNSDGEMFMNFMDYTIGSGKYMFTTDQMIRTQTAMQNSPFRNKLGTHLLCTAVSTVSDNDQTNKVFVYPNPARDRVQVVIGDQELKQISIYHQSGILIQEVNTSMVETAHFAAGIYIMMVQTADRVHAVKLVKD